MLRRQSGGRPPPILVTLMLAGTLAPLHAEAGRRAFLFAYDSEIVPEGDVELEQWWWSETRIARSEQGRPGRPPLYWIWSAPVIGLSNHLELSLPVQISANATTAAVQYFSAEAYYRFFSREKEGGFQPLVRLAYHYPVRQPAPSTAEVDLVLAYGKPNELHLVLNAGAQISMPWPDRDPPLPQPFLPTVSSGISYPLIPGGELRLSGEFLGEFSTAALPRYFVGGALSWTRGRVWLTAGTMVGLTGQPSVTPPFIPRLLWAVAF